MHVETHFDIEIPWQIPLTCQQGSTGLYSKALWLQVTTVLTLALVMSL